VAVAKAAGFIVNWDDFSDLSSAVPLLTRIYPNGSADINHFQAAGGTALLFKELLDNQLLHNDVKTICGEGLELYTKEPKLIDGELTWEGGVSESLDPEVVSTCKAPFKPDGGLTVLSGNIGRSVIKTSALKEGIDVIKAPAVVFDNQYQLDSAFQTGDLNKDCIVVVRFQGPKALGMPELHRLTPPLGVLQDRGYQVALVTDGRMSGASGKVPAAIHLTPEASEGGLISKINNDDLIELNITTGELNVLVDDSVLHARETAQDSSISEHQGTGREMFATMRAKATGAEEGACSLFHSQEMA
jgi:phosphogluconate dehydratase